jgi:hypothetical protein
MASRIDIESYRKLYLKPVEEKLIGMREKIPHFTTQLLEDAIRTELNRANPDTWEVEVPEDKQRAMKEAEDRILEFMKDNFDLGEGEGSVTRERKPFKESKSHPSA